MYLKYFELNICYFDSTYSQYISNVITLQMAHNYSLQEVSRRSVNLTKYEEVFMVWCNSYLTVYADRTIHIFEFSYNLRCIDKNIDCLKCSIRVPETSLATDLFKRLGNGVKGIHFVQMTMDPALWPHSNYLLHEICDVTALEWSPELLWNNDYVLAALTNVGHIEFYRKQRKSWGVALNLSAVIAEHFKEAFETRSDNIEIITKCAYTLQTSAMCWAPVNNEDDSVYFVTAQKNGTVVFWSIKDTEENIKAEYVSQIETEFSDIIKILWIPKGSKVLILCSNILGQIFILELHKSGDTRLTLQNRQMLWSDKDKMVIKHCSYVMMEDKIIYICNKHRHLIVQLLSEDCKVLSQTIKNINDYKISDISKHGNTFIATLLNGTMYQIKCNINNDTLNVECDLINIKDINSTHELHSSSFSSNGTLLALAVVDRKVLYRKELLKVDIIYYTVSDLDFPEFTLLLNNPSKKLTHYCDCIETLRYKIVKWKRIPEYDYKQLLLEGGSDIYKLKVYLTILTICNVLEENFKFNRNTLPESSIVLIKEKIAKAHAKTMVQKLYEKFLSNKKTFTEFEAECFAGGKQYLTIINKKHKTILDIPSKVLDLCPKDFNYVCQSCDKAITEFSCEDGHLNAYCSVTFTPIENDDYLICRGCGAIARSELTKEKPICVYCDLYFEHTYHTF